MPYPENSSKSSQHYGYIDALRGYAILAVIFTHCAQHTVHLPNALRWITDHGKFGVQLFFVVSALTLAISWSRRADGSGRFFVRRLFRIAPMFWLAVPFYLCFGPQYRQQFWAPDGISWIEVVLTILFSHGWHPQSINSVVPGGWSIAVEMTFYLLFPLLIAKITTPLAAVLATLISAISTWLLSIFGPSLLSALMPTQPHYLIVHFCDFWFLNQLPVFLIGFVVFYHLDTKRVSPRSASICLLLIGLCLPAFRFLEIESISHIQYALLFGVITVCLSIGAWRPCVNLPIRSLGTVSFSAYLPHFAVIEFALTLLTRAPSWVDPFEPTGVKFFLTLLGFTVALTFCLSSVTYRFVEQPMIFIGNKFANFVFPVAHTT